MIQITSNDADKLYTEISLEYHVSSHYPYGAVCSGSTRYGRNKLMGTPDLDLSDWIGSVAEILSVVSK